MLATFYRIDEIAGLVAGISAFYPLGFDLDDDASMLVNWAGHGDAAPAVQYMLRLVGIKTEEPDRLYISRVAEWIVGFLGAPKRSRWPTTISSAPIGVARPRPRL